MIWDPLLHWISHVGTGSWGSFKRAVSSLAPSDRDPSAVARTLRTRLSDLGFGEFFIGGTERWSAFEPCLVSSPHEPGEALLCGARTPAIVAKLKSSAAEFNCQAYPFIVDGLTLFRLYGARISDAASAAALKYEPDIGQRLAGSLLPLDIVIRDAASQTPPPSWAARSFDFNTKRWVEGVRQHSAVEFTSRYLERRYYVHVGGSHWKLLPKREALYVAAANRRCQLAAYDSARRELSTPAEAPLPEAYARAACMTAGRASMLRDGRIIYEAVPPRLAGVLLVGLKHSAPAFQICPTPHCARGRR